MTTGIQYVAPDWRTERQVSAAVTLRTGGVSAAPFDSLNLGTPGDDAPVAVAEIAPRARALGLPTEPVWLSQYHSAAVIDLDASDSARPREPMPPYAPSGPGCAIRVADCMPVLLAEEHGAVIGRRSAGWRGLAGGVIEATVEAMASTLRACSRGSARPSRSRVRSGG